MGASRELTASRGGEVVAVRYDELGVLPEVELKAVLVDDSPYVFATVLVVLVVVAPRVALEHLLDLANVLAR